jgi:pre-mRNA-processing factor 19
MFCAVSGQVAEQPVVAGKTGLVYEARVLRKALASNGGRCPVTGTALDAATDLVEVKSSPLVLPRAPSSQSFPALLSTLQNEWDSVLLEQIALRKELAETRRDLAVALYEREAATGVISRLLQENDELRAEVEHGARAAPARGAAAPAADFSSAPASLSMAATAVVAKTEEALLALRNAANKADKSGSGAAGEDKAWSAEGAPLQPHGKGEAVTCIAVDAFSLARAGKAGAGGSALLASGSSEGCVALTDLATRQAARAAGAHAGVVWDLSLHGESLVSAGEDGVFALWRGAKLQHCAQLKRQRPAVAAHVHASGQLCATADAAGAWALWDLERDQVATEAPAAVHGKLRAGCARLHPDGKILGLANEAGELLFFDVNLGAAAKPLATLSNGAPLIALAFSENGYHVASASGSSCAVWDMRKMARLADLACKAPLTALAFDSTGAQLLAGDAAGGLTIFLRPKDKKSEWRSGPHWAGAATGATVRGFAGVAFSTGLASELWAASSDDGLVRHFVRG